MGGLEDGSWYSGASPNTCLSAMNLVRQFGSWTFAVEFGDQGSSQDLVVCSVNDRLTRFESRTMTRCGFIDKTSYFKIVVYVKYDYQARIFAPALKLLRRGASS